MSRSAFLRSAAPAALLMATIGLPGCMKTATYGTGQAPEMAMFREVTGGFLGGGSKSTIAYQPRAPLVMPPSGSAAGGALPAPAEAASAANPAWPDDPDQRERGRREFGDENSRDDISPEEARRLRPLAALGALNQGQPRRGQTGDWSQPAYDMVNDRDKRQKFDAAVNEAEGINITERRYLTDPPDSVRAPAATAQTEFEDIKRKRSGILTRLFMGGG